MTNGATDDGTDARWSLPIVWVGFILMVMTLFAVAGVSIVVHEIAGHAGPPWGFLILWFGALGWNVYWWLFRLAYRVELVGDTLRWQAPFASGTMPVAAIVSARRFFGSYFTCVLRAPGHRSLVVFTQLRSFQPMLAALNRLNPTVPPSQ